MQKFPHDANLLCLAARANMALKRFDAARQQVQSALRQFPDFAAAHDALGDLSLLQGNAAAAVEAYERALRVDPERSASAQKLHRARELVMQASDDDGQRAPRQSMAYPQEISEARQFEKDGEPEKAEKIYRQILKEDPDHVEACRLLGGVAAAHERYREAEVFLQRAVALAPDYPRAWVDLVNVQRELEKFEDATESAEKLIALAPDKAESYMAYASVVGAAGDHDAAIDTYGKVLKISPEKAGALCSMAHHQKTIGLTDDAVAAYRASIAVQADHAEAYWSLANLKTFRFELAEIEAMQSLLEREDLPSESRAQLNNALGLEFEAQKNFDRAFSHFEQCNIVRRQAESYDPVETETTHDRVIEMFDEAFLSQPAGDVVDPAPIFVVGLPRSGSTLIEQILASHSKVDGTHELSDLSKVVRNLRRRSPPGTRFPEVVAPLKPAGWSRIGSEYLSRTERYRAGADFFIDKNPNNFIFAGLLKLAMPNAKIINARRHPLDSCLGTFKQLFASGQPFGYDMDELAEYYLQYQRLMDHWHRVMPGFVLDVHYERVVGDLEGEVRRLLDFCGLPFEDRCLSFHKTERAVKTASSEQVRQPIYSTSVNLWRNYEMHLAPMVHIMAPLLEALPEGDQPDSLLRMKQSSA